MTTPWTQRYALRTHSMSSSAIRELLMLTQQPDLISFAGGLLTINKLALRQGIELAQHAVQVPA